MQQRKPLVSIGLPVHNGARYLDRAISTILVQDLDDFELIISDNGSTDATPDIARFFAGRDPRVRFLRSEQNRGAAWNFNRVFELASGAYFKWVAHDDEHAPAYLSRCVAALEANPQAVLSHTQTVEIDAYGQPLGLVHESFAVDAERPHQRWRHALRLGDCYHVFGVIRAHVLRQTGLIGPFFTSDRVLLAELALHGPFLEVPEPLFLNRDHSARSIYRYADDRSRERWFDPTRPRLSLPRWKLYAGMVRATGRPPLDWSERLRCRVLVGEWVVQRFCLHLLSNPLEVVKRALSLPGYPTAPPTTRNHQRQHRPKTKPQPHDTGPTDPKETEGTTQRDRSALEGRSASNRRS